MHAPRSKRQNKDLVQTICLDKKIVLKQINIRTNDKGKLINALQQLKAQLDPRMYYR